SLYPMWQQVGILARFFWKGLVLGGPSRIIHFMRSMRGARPEQIPLIVSDWIAAISMKEFAQRHLLVGNEARQGMLQSRFEAIRHRFRKYVQDGLVQISIDSDRPTPNVSLRL